MDSVDFHAILSENKDKHCTLYLKNGEVVSGINRGVSYDGFGCFCASLENRGLYRSIKNPDVESININE